MDLISFDPGLREMGVCAWRKGRLQAAALLRGEQDTSIRDVDASQAMSLEFADWLRGVLSVDRCSAYTGDVAYEKMQHYASAPQAKVDDLFQLVGVSHACCSALQQADVTPIKPSTWTSGRPKSVNHKRIAKRLDDAETEIMSHVADGLSDSDVEHVIDACGIGLYYHRRL